MKRRRRILWAKVVSILISLFAVCTLFYIYFISGIFTIKNYNLIGVEDQYVEVVKENLNTIANNKIFGVFPGNRSITPHRKEIKLLIQELLPNTSSVKIYASSLHVLTIEISSYQPLFSVSDTHAITSEGVIYKEIHDISNLPRINIATSTLVKPETLRSLSVIIPRVDNVLYSVKNIIVDENNDVYLYDISKIHAVIISANQDMVKSWSTILSALDTDPLKGELETKKDQLDYIDARFGNKIFYKFTKKESIPSSGMDNDDNNIDQNASTSTSTIQ